MFGTEIRSVGPEKLFSAGNWKFSAELKFLFAELGLLTGQVDSPAAMLRAAPAALPGAPAPALVQPAVPAGRDVALDGLGCSSPPAVHFSARHEVLKFPLVLLRLHSRLRYFQSPRG